MDLKVNINSLRLVDKCFSSQEEVLQELAVYESDLQTLLAQAQNFVQYHHRFSEIPTSKRHLQ